MARSPEKATSLCHACPKLCRFSCPVADAERDESTTPWGKMSAMKLADQGILPFDEKTARLAYLCLNCRASQQVCELDNPVPPTLNHYRSRAIDRRVAPPAVFEYLERFQTHTNPFGRDLHFSLRRLYHGEWRHPPTKNVYFPGCEEIRYFPRAIGSSLKLLRRQDPGISLYREPLVCCGYPLYAAGDLQGFRELAEINSQALRKFRQVISGTPACLHTMETLYAEQGFRVPARFFHTSEKLVGAIHELPLHKSRNPKRIAYHDPCYLGRYRGVYEQPRKLIESATGKQPIEFFRNREQSYCCGAGGLLPISAPETARKITENRLAEFRRTGADTLVTACPTCVHRFKQVDPKVEVKGLIEFLCPEP